MSFLKNKALGFFVKTNGFFSNLLFSGRGIVLMFHRVRPANLMSSFEQNRKWEITPEHLEQIIVFFLKEKLNIIASTEIEYYFNYKSL